MASLDSLPADQRAVIQLVLQRGRSYDEIAAMLSIDRAAVRQRALDGFDALGPENSISAPERALLTDYLLGQLPPRVADQVAEKLGDSPPQRAWTRVIASEIGGLAPDKLPEIPVGSTRREPAAAPSEPVAAPEPAAAAEYQQYEDQPTEAAPKIPADYGLDQPAAAPDGSSPEGPPSSRVGGAILLGLVALVVVVLIVIVVATSGGGKKHHAAKTTASNTATTSTTASTASTPTTSTTGTTTSKAKLLAQINLTSPTGAKNTAGVAQVIQSGTTIGVVIVAQGVPANTTHNAYAVWLYNSASDNKFVGFVNQRVAATGTTAGKLETEGALPANASHYKEMLLTLETQQKPTSPGQIVLQGAFSIP
jgi:hypothetical protein